MADKNQEVEKRYTINLDDNGKLESILVEEERGFGRWLYKREPKGMELPLTDAIFEETTEVYLDYGGFLAAEEVYNNLKVQDEYYANLMKKVYKQYLKRYVFESSLHQDAFWRD